MSLIAGNVRYALRSLARTPWFTCTTVAILAVGLGLVMFMFGAVQAFMLRPLPYPEGENLAYVHLARSDNPRSRLSPQLHEFLDLAQAQTSFESFAGYYEGTVNLSGDHRPERYDGAIATANLFRTLRVEPALGRTFSDGANAPGAPQEVVLGDALWEQRYARDPAVVGKAIQVNGRAATIVGVAPADFTFPRASKLWVAATLDPGKVPRGQGSYFDVVARLKAGVAMSTANSEMESIAKRLSSEQPGSMRGDSARAYDYAQRAVGPQTRSILTTMFVAVCFVLLIACANVANLLLARSIAHARETAVRTALGASRRHLVALVLSEAVAISLVAALIGYVLAQWGGELTMAMIASSEDPPPRWTTHMSIDIWSLAFAGGIALVAALLAGLIPAMRTASASSAQVMREGGQGGIGGMGRLGRILVTAEIALCVVLLVCAGLTVRSSIAAQGIETGADTRNVLSGRVALFEAQYPQESQTITFTEQLERRLAEIPGVKAATITSSLPMTFGGGNIVRVEGAAPVEDNKAAEIAEYSTSPSFFGMLSIPLLRGRTYDSRDLAGADPVIVLNQRAVERLFPDGDPIGKRVRLGSQKDEKEAWRTVIGVVGNVVHDGDDLNDNLEASYLPFAQRPTRFVSFAVKTQGEPHALDDAVRNAVQSVDASQPVYFLRTLDDWITIAAFDHILLARLFGLFGLFAVVLSAAGLYAVLSYAVGQRTREIGVRRALGASDRSILGMVWAQGSRQIGIGLSLGLLLAFGFARLLGNFLYGVGTFDPTTFVGSVLLFGIVGFVASTVPARRALTVAPIQALRYE